MRTPLFLLTAMAGATACAVAAQTLPAHTPPHADAFAVCQAVAQGRATFLDVPGDDELSEHHPTISVDVDNDGNPEQASIVTGGTSHTPSIWIGDNDYVESEFEADGTQYQPWGGGLRLLQYHGLTYEVFYSDADTSDYPQYVGIHMPDHHNELICSFTASASTPQLEPVRADTEQVCHEVARRHESEDGDFPFTPLPRDTLIGNPELSAVAQSQIDVMNDGSALRVRQLELESGAGAGCGATVYDLANQQGSSAHALYLLQTMAPQIGDRYPIRTANGYAACHGNVGRFLSIGGKVVFEQRFPGQYPSRHDQEFWWVSAVENGQPVRLCEARIFPHAPPTIHYNSNLYPRSPLN